MRAIVSQRGVLSANQGRFLILVALVAAWAWLTPFGSAQEAHGQRREEVTLVKKKLTVGTKEAPPFSMKDTDGR